LRAAFLLSKAPYDLGSGIRRVERGLGLAGKPSGAWKRATDVIVSAAALLVLCIPLLLLAGLVRVTSPGPAIHWSRRVGRGNALFRMPKFRTMRIGAPQVATHLMSEPERWLTPIGGFLRRTSLDELPQLISVLKGDMSLVGPRPALFNQDDLVALRTAAGVQALRPGLTGWAQVNGRDELPIPDKVTLDAEYLARMSLGFDLRILGMTLAGVLGSKGVSH
jgi:O-antigen biosynthesis protein WbqP